MDLPKVNEEKQEEKKQPVVVKKSRLHSAVNLEQFEREFDIKRFLKDLSDELKNRGLNTPKDFRTGDAPQKVIPALMKALRLDATTLIHLVDEDTNDG